MMKYYYILLTDLLLLGFGELTLQNFSISGNRDAFEESNPTLSEDFSSNYRMSMLANGDIARGLLLNGTAIVDSRIDEEYRTIDPSIFRLRMSMNSTEPLWGAWRFTGRGVYDPNRQWELENLDMRLLTQPQESSKLEMLMRLESDKHGLVEGGSIRPSFKGSKFTLHQRSLFGGYADLRTGKVGAEAVAGKLEGKTFRAGSTFGIRANGTTGPYDLANPPITRGSDEVKIEVRDRFDESDDYFSGKGKALDRRIWETNFIPDVRRFELTDKKERGAGGRGRHFEMAFNTMGAHTSEFPVGTYKKGHRHGPGAHVIIIKGKGYTLMWPEGSPKERFDWQVGSILVPPDRWFHQHFNTGTEPARYLVQHVNSPLIWDKHVQIEYVDEDPEIRKLFESELAKSGINSKMPPECYTDPNYQWERAV